jgi:RNA 3'-phosphate cyclase
MGVPSHRLRIEQGVIRIDASYGEGGGQIVRTACALSALTGIACELTRIRAGRSKPGLRPQHCAAVRGLAKLCGASCSPLKPGLEELSFSPGRLCAKDLSLDTGTAGSVGLVLQGLLIAGVGLDRPVRILLRGGTDVPFAPPADYVRSVLAPLLGRMGYRVDVSVLRRGYYPKGGGVVDVHIRPPETPLLKPLEIPASTEASCCYGVSHAARVLSERKVAERQRKRAQRKLTDFLHVPAKIVEEYGSSNSPGSGIVVWIETQESILGASALGETGKSAEEVAEEAAERLFRTYHSQASLDPWMGDQILPYLALSDGPSTVSVPNLTRHMQSNMWVLERFLNVRFRIEEAGPHVRVRCEPEA